MPLFNEIVERDLKDFPAKKNWDYNTALIKLTPNQKKYRKKNVKVPNTCIEAAQFVVICKHGFKEWEEDMKGAKIFAGGKANDLEDMTLKAISKLGGILDVDEIEPGDGLALINTQTTMAEGMWTCHAIGIVAVNRKTQEFVAVDVCADLSDPELYANTQWTMSYFRTISAFTNHYASFFGKFVLAKIYYSG